jgi:hypothetical protein
MKKIFFVLAVVIAVSIPVAVFAATSDSKTAANIRGFCGIGINTSNLTEQQKTDLDDSFNKMIELRKETINKMVQDGLLTKEQGDSELKKLDEMIKYHNENGYSYGSGMMGGCGSGRGMMGSYGGNGMMRGY